jgi:hypothetical protein
MIELVRTTSQLIVWVSSAGSPPSHRGAQRTFVHRSKAFGSETIIHRQLMK